MSRTGPALLFAYKTTTGSAPLYLNSLLQTYEPLEACVLQVNITLLFVPKRHKITFTDNEMFAPGGMTQLDPIS